MLPYLEMGDLQQVFKLTWGFFEVISHHLNMSKIIWNELFQFIKYIWVKLVFKDIKSALKCSNHWIYALKLVLSQPAWGIFVFWKYLDTMCLDCLALREDPSAFEVSDPCKYFQNFIKLIGIDIAISSFFQVNQAKMSWWQYQFQLIL